MHVQTRAHLVATSLHATTFICITEQGALNAYHAMTLYNPVLAGRISSLEVRFSHPVPNLLQRLRQILRHLCHIDTLIIQIPPISVSECHSLFESLHFPNLVLFSCGTLPHKGVLQFLLRNPHISTIIMKPCMSCPCARPNDRPSLNVSEISGPTACIAPLIRGSPLTRVAATYGRGSDSHVPLFTSLTLISANVTNLTLDFTIERDFDILRSIAAATPFVTTLELHENHTGRQRVYPWNDVVRWANDLRSLTFLARFFLRTSASLVNRPGNKADERHLIRRWSGETMQFPPQLQAIELWYLWKDPGLRVSALWERGGLRWQRMASTASQIIVS